MMTTEQQVAAFFRRVLPPQASYGLAVDVKRAALTEPRKFYRPAASFTTFEDLARAAVATTTKGCSFYSTCGFADPRGPQTDANGNTRVSIVHDVDFKGGAAPVDLAEFKTLLLDAIKAGLPKPNVMVLSGGGAHLYWLWKTLYAFNQTQHAAMAAVFKRWFQHRAPRLIQDHVSLTTFNRLLRVPGSTNYKIPGQPRPVRLVYDDGGFISLPKLQAMQTEVRALPGQTPRKVTRAAQPVVPATPMGALAVDEAPTPADKATDILTKCGVMRDFVSRLKPSQWDEFDEPRWKQVAILLAKSPDGERVWKEMSRRDPRADRRSTEDELTAQWERLRGYAGGGVVTCATLKTHFEAPRADGTSPCAACPVFLSGRPNAGPGNFSVYERQHMRALRTAPVAEPLAAEAYPPLKLPPVRHILPLVYSERDPLTNTIREVPLHRADAYNKFFAQVARGGPELFWYIRPDGALHLVRFSRHRDDVEAINTLRNTARQGHSLPATHEVVHDVQIMTLAAIPVERAVLEGDVHAVTFQCYAKGSRPNVTADDNIRQVTTEIGSFSGAAGITAIAKATGNLISVGGRADWELFWTAAHQEISAKTSTETVDFAGYNLDDGQVQPTTEFCHGTLRITHEGYGTATLAPRYLPLSKSFDRHGDPEEQRRLLREYMAHANPMLSATVWAALSAPLYAILANVRAPQALPVLVVHGRNSSGKSKALTVGCSLWGKAALLKEGAGGSGSTTKAREAAVALYTNIPMFQDEIITSLGDDALAIFKQFSNHQESKRLTAQATHKSTTRPKQSLLIGMSNVDPIDYIMAGGGARQVPYAASSVAGERLSVARRVVSWRYDPNDPENVRPAEVLRVLDTTAAKLADHHYGFLGPAFVRHVLNNLPRVREILGEEYDHAEAALPSAEVGMATYAQFQAAAVAAARIGAEMGYWMEEEAAFYRKVVQKFMQEAKRAADGAASTLSAREAYGAILERLRDLTLEIDGEQTDPRHDSTMAAPANGRAAEAKRVVFSKRDRENSYITVSAFSREAQRLGLSPGALIDELDSLGFMPSGRQPVEHAVNVNPHRRAAVFATNGLKSKCYAFTTPCYSDKELRSAKQVAAELSAAPAGNVVPLPTKRKTVL